MDKGDRVDMVDRVDSVDREDRVDSVDRVVKLAGTQRKKVVDTHTDGQTYILS